MLEDDNSYIINCLVDRAYKVPPDMRSHTGTMMVLLKVYTCNLSLNHNININNYTEMEVVSNFGIFHQIIWTRDFWGAQAYGVK